EQARVALCYSHYRQNFSFLKKKFFNARTICVVIRETLIPQPAGVHPTKSARAFYKCALPRAGSCEQFFRQRERNKPDDCRKFRLFSELVLLQGIASKEGGAGKGKHLRVFPRKDGEFCE